MEQNMARADGEILKRRISFLENLLKSTFVTPEKREEYERTLEQVRAKLAALVDPRR